jgi:heme oxygenase (biliverdin-IX-beta and delta-forming)
MAPSPAPTLRELLKERTAAAHRALEQLPLMRALSDGALSNDAYAEYLRRQARLHAPLEAAIWPWAPPIWQRLRLVKTDWLNADLEALGMAGAGPAAPVPPVQSYAQALGVMYVLEGSTLGLQVVLRRMRPDHVAWSTAGTFMRGYRSETGSFWRYFVADLDALPVADWPPVAAAALATFAAFHQCFADAGDAG